MFCIKTSVLISSSVKCFRNIFVAEAYLGTCQTSEMKLFYENTQQVLAVNYYRKKAQS